MARPKKILTPEQIEELENKTVEYEYKNYTIIEEDSTRVIVADRGLYVDEFETADQAKEYIDGRTV